MKSKFTTVVLFLVAIILVLGIVVLGGAIYNDLLGGDTSDIIRSEEHTSELQSQR